MLSRREVEASEEPLLLATTDEIPGFASDEFIGFVAGFASDRTHALELMEKSARERGANAVVGIRIHSSASGGAFVSNDEAFAYGTAVRVQPAGAE